MSRISAKKLLLVQWSRFQKVEMSLEGSSLITGVNGSGKSTILDAMIYLLTGSTQFNIAAKDRDRSVVKYVRGDTNSDGDNRYLRVGEVISYIVMEFYTPITDTTDVVGVCIESKDPANSISHYFLLKDTSISKLNFYTIENNILKVTPKNQIVYKGKKLKSSEYMRKEQGISQIQRALGLRCDSKLYQRKIIKMMAFNPENNIDRFIQESILDDKPIHSLNDLREQRDHLDKIKELYEKANIAKKQLSEILEKSKEYEIKNRDYEIKNMILNYQTIQVLKSSNEANSQKIINYNSSINSYQNDADSNLKKFNDYNNRASKLENSDEHSALINEINQLQNDITLLEADIKNNDHNISLLKQLTAQTNSFDPLDYTSTSISLQDKIETFNHIKVRIEALINSLNNTIYALNSEIQENEQHIAILSEEKRALEANQIPFPRDYEETRRIIEESLKKEGIDTDVAFFASKVEKINDEKYRKAIETFLGNKRFDIIVEGKYCQKAVQILQDKKIHKGYVIYSDQLEDSEIKKNSAAGLLEIPNPYARKYANYLLNGIHLCKDIDELHDYPKGGLTSDGMLAKSYRVNNMDMSRTRVYMGQDAIKIQLKQVIKDLDLANKKQVELETKLKEITKECNTYKAIDLNINNYDFNAPSKKMNDQLEIGIKKQQISEIKNDEGFLTVSNQIDELKRQAQDCFNLYNKSKEKITTCNANIRHLETQINENNNQIKYQEAELKEKTGNNQALYKEMINEYYELVKRRKSDTVIQERSVKAIESEKNKLNDELKLIQFNYANQEGLDITYFGSEYIGYYRKRYNDLVNIEMEDIQVRLDQQSKKLEETFMLDFIGELQEAIKGAKEEVSNINKELRQLPFGSDTYRFELNEKTDRNIFFRIIKRIDENYVNANMYLSLRNDEQLEADIHDFINTILEVDDESEYTDYRNYFNYDMKIESKLSRKQGSASNGEKQTPYFIILAASLMQCYKGENCIRLAFIDEAFSALSKERIEQMVKYFESNHFQVIYAAPPEKINSIGSYINTTISLVSKGRYTNVVEGIRYDIE